MGSLAAKDYHPTNPDAITYWSRSFAASTGDIEGFALELLRKG
jgi:hypothetical protein